MTTLSIEEQTKILLRIEKQKANNKLRQQKFRDKRKDNEEYKTDRNEYQKDYQKKLKDKYNEIQGITNEIVSIPTPLNVEEIVKPPILSKKTKRHNKKMNITTDTKPAYIERKKQLESSTIIEYIKKLNIIHKRLTTKPFNTKLKSEINKIINDNDYNEDLIKTDMIYLEDIENTINLLRDHYKNDNSLRSYLVALTVLLSHLPSFNNQYQIITKVAKKLDEINKADRATNILPKMYEKKIIDLEDEDILIKNINSLTKIEDKLIFSLYTLFPARREDDYRLMKITYNQKEDKLDVDYNYLQISKNKDMYFIFNEYKTKSTYGQQKFKVPEEIKTIINMYINQNNLKELDLLFYSNNDKKDKKSASNFSTQISNVFKKVYDIPISIRFLRKSHATYLYNISHKEKWDTLRIEEYTDMMSHSINESSLYRVIGFK